MVLKTKKDFDAAIAQRGRIKNIKFLYLSYFFTNAGDRIKATILSCKRRYIHNYHSYFQGIKDKVQYLKRMIDFDPNFDTSQIETFASDWIAYKNSRPIGWHTKVCFTASSINRTYRHDFTNWVASYDLPINDLTIDSAKGTIITT